MTELECCYGEAEQVESWSDWCAFERKWFNRNTWPSRRSPQPTPLSEHSKDLISQDRRRWTRTVWSYDLSAEARYHYFFLLLTVGATARFPHLHANNTKQDTRWMWNCPYCEIATNEPGEPNCPICDRALLAEYIES